MPIDIKEGIKTGRLRELSYDQVKQYQFDEDVLGEDLLELIKKGSVKAWWDNLENKIIYGKLETMEMCEECKKRPGVYEIQGRLLCEECADQEAEDAGVEDE